MLCLLSLSVGVTISFSCNQLMDVVAALPRKLVVFVTHHHYDHVDGKFQYEIVKYRRMDCYVSLHLFLKIILFEVMEDKTLCL